MACQEHDFGFRGDSPYFVSDLHSVHARHIDVQKNNLWLQFDNFFNAFFAVFSLTAHFEGVPIEQRPNGLPRNGMVVHDKYSRWQTAFQLEIASSAEGAGSPGAGTL
jgi:hypothetical protein